MMNLKIFDKHSPNSIKYRNCVKSPYVLARIDAVLASKNVNKNEIDEIERLMRISSVVYPAPYLMSALFTNTVDQESNQKSNQKSNTDNTESNQESDIESNQEPDMASNQELNQESNTEPDMASNQESDIESNQEPDMASNQESNTDNTESGQSKKKSGRKSKSAE